MFRRATAEPYYIDPTARAHQAYGVMASTEGRLERAHDVFMLGELALAPALQQGEPWAAVQQAGLERDEAWLGVRARAWDRQLPGEDEGDPHDWAIRHFDSSVRRLEQQMRNLVAAGDRGPVATAQLRRVYAELGATQSGIVRLALVEHAIADKAGEPIPLEQRIVDQRLAGRRGARNKLRLGDNRYFEASHAIRAATAERSNGRLLHIGPWLGQAAACLAEAIVFEPANPNTRRALATTVRVGAKILSPTNAILARP